MPCTSCDHFDDDGSDPRCRRYPPQIVSNTGLGPNVAEYPLLQDLKGCGEHKPTRERVHIRDPRTRT